MQNRPARLCAALARTACRAALRAAIAGLIFTTCLWATLSYLGLPVPDPYEMLERLGSVSRLAEILS